MKNRLRIFTIFAITSFLVSPIAYASSLSDRETKIMRAVENIVAEHRIYATCSSLDLMSLKIVRETWKKEVERASDTLQKSNPSESLNKAFVSAVDFKNLLNQDATLGSAIEFCHTSEKTLDDFFALNFSSLSAAIEKITQSK